MHALLTSNIVARRRQTKLIFARKTYSQLKKSSLSLPHVCVHTHNFDFFFQLFFAKSVTDQSLFSRSHAIVVVVVYHEFFETQKFSFAADDIPVRRERERMI
jgi:hypothetical protein